MTDLLQRLDTLDWNRWSGPATTSARIVLILVAAWVAIVVIQRLVRTLRLRVTARLHDREAVRRAETLGRAARYTVAVVIGGLALMMILGEVGVSLAPILGAAGVAGVAIGFGAQSLVKDYFTGFFLLFEDQIRTGDVVKIAGIGGLVEDLTLRHVRLRDYDGNVHFVPNSLITTVTNMSREFAFSVVDVGIAYRENLDEVFAAMRETGRELRADDVLGPLILADLEIAGVEQWADSAVLVRCRFKVTALAQWDVRRAFLKRLKEAFDRRGIEIPYPHMTVYAGADKTGDAQPLRLRIDTAGGTADAPAAQPS